MSSYAILAAATVGGQILGFVGLTIVARRVGPTSLGAYGFANSLSGYFALPAMAGVAMAGIRELATPGTNQKRTVAEVQGFLVLNGLIAYLALVLLTSLLSTSPVTRILLPIAGLPLIVNPLGCDWAMQGLQRLRPLALYRLLGQVAYLVLLLAILTHGRVGVERYAVSNVVGFAVTALLTTQYVWRKLGLRFRPTIGAPRELMRRVFARVRGSVAMSLSLVMIQTYYSLDLVLLGYLVNNHSVGEYTTASRLPMAVTAMAALWVTAFYPHAAALFHKDKEQLRQQVGRFVSLSSLLVLPIAPLGFLLGSRIMTGMFGAAYGPGGSAFAILLCSAGVALLNSNVGQVLLACGDDRAFFLSVTIGTILNIVLNLALIPLLGIVGSALATLAAEIAIVAAVSARFWRILGPISFEWRRFVRASAAMCGALPVLFALRDTVPWWATIVATCVAYAGLLFVTRAVTVRELASVLRRDAGGTIRS